MTDSSTSSPDLRILPGATAGRRTPPPVEARFRDILAGLTTVVGRAVGLEATLPGARDVRAVTGVAGGAQPGAGGSAPVPLDAAGVDYLRLQERIGAETRRFTTLSNVMKARHEAAQTAINNIG